MSRQPENDAAESDRSSGTHTTKARTVKAERDAVVAGSVNSLQTGPSASAQTGPIHVEVHTHFEEAEASRPLRALRKIKKIFETSTEPKTKVGADIHQQSILGQPPTVPIEVRPQHATQRKAIYGLSVVAAASMTIAFVKYYLTLPVDPNPQTHDIDSGLHAKIIYNPTQYDFPELDYIHRNGKNFHEYSLKKDPTVVMVFVPGGEFTAGAQDEHPDKKTTTRLHTNTR